MGDLGHELWFGCFLTPDARQAQGVVELTRFADQIGLDLVGIQDHPYQPRFLDAWTLLSVLASETTRIRLVPDVINLPLRPPGVLAKAAASLDILSNGRVELGLGAGGFFDAIVSIGGPRRTPGEATDALAEAIQIIKALWTPGKAVTFAGQHYQLKDAQPGPIPPHPIGIWLGSYKPRMLRLTGELADGWVPSAAYAPPAELTAMTHAIDEAARAAGRDPAAIRRVYNINGRFSSSEQGFLQGPPRLWVEQLSELALEQGMSVFVLAPGQDVQGDLQRFADEVAPALREVVAQARAGARPPATPILEITASNDAPLQSARPRRNRTAPQSAALNEDQRPHATSLAGGTISAAGRQSQETLLQVHQHLRQELSEILEAAAQVAAGSMTPAQARSVIYRTTMRQNYWTLGAFCAQYCRVVSIHHTIEDQQLFPSLGRGDAALSPVLVQLEWEHEIIAEQLERVDQALVAMMEAPERVEQMRAVATELEEMLLSHLAYEEDELLEPIGRLGIVV